MIKFKCSFDLFMVWMREIFFMLFGLFGDALFAKRRLIEAFINLLLWVRFLLCLNLGIIRNPPFPFKGSFFQTAIKEFIIISSVGIFIVGSGLIEQYGHVVFFEHDDSENDRIGALHFYIERIIVILKILWSINGYLFAFETDYF